MGSNLYLITGEEAYEKQEKLEQIKADFGECVKGINYIALDKTNINSLEDEINTYPFGFSRKLIIVKIDKKEKASESADGGNDSEILENVEEKNDWLTPSLEETLKNLEDVTVVLLGDIKKTTRIYKLVQKYGECIVCDKKKEYGENYSESRKDRIGRYAEYRQHDFGHHGLQIVYQPLHMAKQSLSLLSSLFPSAARGVARFCHMQWPKKRHFERLNADGAAVAAPEEEAG